LKSGSVSVLTHSVRDWLAAGLLFVATASFVLWQNSQVAVLWDLSYLLDTSYRIALGQTPYRDFPLVHPPLTFVVQAFIMRVGGRLYLLPLGYAALIGGFGTVVSWRIVLHALRSKIALAWLVSLLLAAPLVLLGIYSIYPHPIYDCDCTFAILVAVFLLQRFNAERATSAVGGRLWIGPSLAGAAVVIPMFFKQNMGLPFLLAVVAGVMLLIAVNFWRPHRKQVLSWALDQAILFRLIAAFVLSCLAAILVIQLTAGLGNYLHWTVHFAAQRRLPGFADMLQVYRQPSFLWTLPTLGLGLFLLHSRLAARAWVRIAALCLASAPFAGSLVFLFFEDDLDERADNLLALWPLLLLISAVYALTELRKGITLQRLLPFFVLAAIHGTFLSQQLWGSTYAIWPLLIILIAYILAALPGSSGKIAVAFAAVISATFLVCGGLYAIGHERLDYIQIPDEPLRHSTLPALRGMAVRGPFLPDLDQLIRFTDEQIPRQEGILLLPGEEPFFYATGRVPQFPVQIFDQTTDPYSPNELLQEARNRNIRWVIVKTRLQSNENPLPEREQTMFLIVQDYSLYRELGGFAVYRRKARNFR
jgi:hypothetical protein